MRNALGDAAVGSGTMRAGFSVSFEDGLRSLPKPIGGSEACRVGARWLGGEAEETLFGPATFMGESAGFRLFETDDFLLGYCVETAREDLTVQAHSLYRRLLDFADGRHVARVWNYLPGINEIAGGIENYRAFCRGRALAFETHFGVNYPRYLPAASAVGGGHDQCALVFAASVREPRRIENPEQVPAYRYPTEHGPFPPSFVRAAVLDDPAGLPAWVFVSGTAAIKGHRSFATGNLTGQIDCTLDNLRLVSRACGLGDALGAGGPWTRHFKVYLRHAEHLGAARSALAQRLFLRNDRVIWLQSEICRSTLDVEIEVTLKSAWETPG